MEKSNKKKLYTLAKRTNYNKSLNPVELTAHVKNIKRKKITITFQRSRTRTTTAT
jgi:hypothetical protein